MPQVVAGVPASKEAIMASSSSSAAAPAAAKQLAFTLPTSPDTKVYLHITNLDQSLMVHVATGSPAGSSSSSPASLGSFVLAMPNSKNPTEQPASTPLYNQPESVDFMNRFAKVLAKKFNKPVYVGGDVKFWTPEDEGVAMRGALQAVQDACGST